MSLVSSSFSDSLITLGKSLSFSVPRFPSSYSGEKQQCIHFYFLYLTEVLRGVRPSAQRLLCSLLGTSSGLRDGGSGRQDLEVSMTSSLDCKLPEARMLPPWLLSF